MYDIKSDLNFSIYYRINFILLSLKKKSLLTGMYDHFGHHILNEEEKNSRINNALAYDPKE